MVSCLEHPSVMEGFLHHMAPQFLHPALQSFGCGAFRPIGGAFHPLYPGKAFARHLGEQYALGQSVGQALRVSFNIKFYLIWSALLSNE